MKTKFIYLLHFSKPYKGRQHYLGSTNNVCKRLKEHRKGRGSKFVRAVIESGIKLKVVKVWMGDKNLEREMKQQFKLKQLCPLCDDILKKILEG